MELQMKIDGGCYCGALKYEAEIDCGQVGICHCTDCQIISGTAFRVVSQIPKSKFNLLKGEPKTYTKIAESGRPRILAFCENCGTHIYATGPSDDIPIGLRIGTCNQRGQLKPNREGYRSSALPWIGDLGTDPDKIFEKSRL
tara:strand:- start:292 stop:717 length:426 start_codon:yes stop_codon:yes gene_type:complete